MAIHQAYVFNSYNNFDLTLWALIITMWTILKRFFKNSLGKHLYTHALISFDSCNLAWSTLIVTLNTTIGSIVWCFECQCLCLYFQYKLVNIVINWASLQTFVYMHCDFARWILILTLNTIIGVSIVCDLECQYLYVFSTFSSSNIYVNMASFTSFINCNCNLALWTLNVHS